MSHSLNIPSFSGSISSPFERATTPSQRLSSPRYERNIQGDMEFKYEVDVCDYRPEEVKVSHNGYTVTIDASCVKKTKAQEQSSSCSRSEKKEYHKTITLPQNADISAQLETYYESGKLILKLPILAPAFPLSSSPFTHSTSYHSSHDNNFFGISFDSGSHTNPSKIYQETLHLDPEFSKADIKVSVNGQTVLVSARRKENDVHGCSSNRQYNSQHIFPTNTDLNQVQADWSHGELVISAPYKNQ